MSIELQKVDFAYGNTAVCRELSWRLPPQGIICLWGASGCGKTTLLRLLCGLEQPQAGRIVRPSGLRTAVCFQEDRLLPWRTALENVFIAAGCGREDVVLCRVYISDIALWDEVNAVYAAFFGSHKPARVVVPTRALHHGALVEIEAVAELKN